MKKLFFAFIFISAGVHGQTVTTPMLYQKIDSMSSTLDSITTKVAIAATSAMVNIDTLTLPANSYGIFNLFLFSYDTAGHYTGGGLETVAEYRIGTVYATPMVLSSSTLPPTGTTTHQIYSWLGLQAGFPVITVNGYGSGTVIRWHLMKEAKISPL